MCIISTLIIHDISITNCTDQTFYERIVYNRNTLNPNKGSRNNADFCPLVKCLQCLGVADDAQNWGCRPGWSDRPAVSCRTRLGAELELENTGTALVALWFSGLVMEQEEECGRNIWGEKVLHTNTDRTI